MTDFRSNLHPRDRRGQFRDVLGQLSKPDRLTNEFEVGITPYREGGTATGKAYYATTRYKGFEHSLPMMAAKRGLHYHTLDRVGGVWAGGDEPSAQVRVTGDREKVISFMDAAGSRYNQDAVIAFTSKDDGPSTRYLSEPGSRSLTNAEVAKAIETVNKDKPEAEQVQGATVHADGRLELLDLEDTATETILELMKKLGVVLRYDEGEAFLRFKGSDYPDAQGRLQTQQGRVARKAGSSRGETDERHGPKAGDYDPDLYRRFGLEVADREA